ncbi:MAG: M14 family zinc carboxypeptidase [Colwellia sp.]
MLFRRIVILLFLISQPLVLHATSVRDYLPAQVLFNPNIATPSSVLGFEVGQKHLRHDQLKQYFYHLAKQADNVKLTNIGYTAQQREQFLVTISSTENLANLDGILAKRHIPNGSKEDDLANEPLVIWLGYSVHGDEMSGANAAMIVAYYLAASKEQSIKDLLANTIIVLEPSINPDGMDRFVNWVTTYQNTTANSDANHIEHHQRWVSGRTNHYWFDLNRDWLLLSQQESQHRLKYYHRYQPNVLGDFHEMGPNSSYFFQPGVNARTHPLTPIKNIELTKELATFHAKALDQKQRLYYSEESFDDFYYGKGSTYPDINGAVGILFEQASARGMQQQTVNGLLTFEYGIQNHVLTSLSTIKGAWHNRDQLKNYRHDFYQQSLKQAEKEKFSGYLIRETKDKYRLTRFLDTLTQHQIKVYPLKDNYKLQGEVFNKSNSYYIPIVQPQYRVIQALFNQQTHFKDNTFYDVSGWTMPLAMNIEFHQIDRNWGLTLADKPWAKANNPLFVDLDNFVELDKNSYAYAFEWHDFLAPKLLNKLLSNNIKVRVATKTFSSIVSGKAKHFATGSLIIPVGIQTQSHWRKLLVEASIDANIPLANINTGLTIKGVDLGSNSFVALKPVKVLMLGGQGISQYEAGEIRYYLDKTLNIPLSVIDHARLGNVDLSSYSHIILVDGRYNNIAENVTDKVKAWVKQGGVIIGQKRATKWLAKQKILSVKFVTQNQMDSLFDIEQLSYQDKNALAARQHISGAIFATELDTSHPLTFGYRNTSLPLFRNSTIMMELLRQPFITVAKYTATPLISGYTDNNLVDRLAHSPAIVAHNVGQGRVIATTDVLAFRGYWLGSAKLLANSLFFAKIFSTPVKSQSD